MANPIKFYVTQLGNQQPSASDLTDGTTGSGGAVVLATSPTLTTPTLGVASCTRIGVGGASAGAAAIYVNGTPTTGASQFGIDFNPTIGSDSTTSYNCMLTAPALSAAVFTITDFYHFRIQDAVLGAGSAITNQYGFYVPSAFAHAGTLNYGFFSAGAVANNLGTGTTTIGTASVVTALVPTAAGAFDVGSAALPFSGIHIGGAATNNARLTATTTAARTVTFPDANLNLSNAKANAGVPQIGAGPAKLTAQSAAISAALAFATGTAPGAGLYRISYVATVTTVDAGGSTLGGANGFQLIFTNANGDSVVKTSNPTAVVVSAGNTTGTTISGDLYGYAAASTNINYSFGYASSGGLMRYDLVIYVEFLG